MRSPYELHARQRMIWMRSFPVHPFDRRGAWKRLRNPGYTAMQFVYRVVSIRVSWNPGKYTGAPYTPEYPYRGGKLSMRRIVVSIGKSVTFSLSGYSKPVAYSIA
jgi:hypothetical protein